jgi:hypothetical protein
MILTWKNRSTGRKTCSVATLSTTNLTWTGRGTNPSLRCEKLATNSLNYGMTKIRFKKYLFNFNIYIVILYTKIRENKFASD